MIVTMIRQCTLTLDTAILLSLDGAQYVTMCY